MSDASRLEECLNSLHALAECLQAERHAIRDNDLDSLGKISHQKQQITGQLQRLLTESIPEAGRSVSDMIESIIENASSQDQSGTGHPELQQELLTKLVECRDLNAANGAAIHVRRSHVSNALRLLLSQAGDPSTYSPEQPVVQFQASRTLADA